MFRRREDGSDDMMNDTSEPSAATTPQTPSTPSIATPSSPSAAPAAAASAAATPAMPSSAPAAQSFRPAPPQAAMAAANRTPATPVTPSTPTLATPAAAPAAPMVAPRANNKRVLTVGPDIQMKGEITSCDRVVIEGMVDATMRDVHTVELAETGSLKGTAEVEDAEISGSFEGDLTVRGKITIHSSGRVRGNVTYGEIEIQRGGQISGNIRNAADAKSAPQGKAKAA